MADVTTVENTREVDLNDARPRRWGWWLLVVGFGGFMLWALLAPLDAGVSAPGTVVVVGNRKAVQPLVAGKIAAVLVKDGDEVKAGQTLVRLDDTQSRSQLDISQGQWLTSLATEARMVAERAGRSTPDFPAALLNEKSDPRASTAMALQTQLLATRRGALNSELSAMAENIRGLELQTQGTEASRRAKQEQLNLLNDMIKNQRALADEGFLPRNRVLEQERAAAGIAGAMAEDLGTIGRNRQSMAEIKTRMATRQQEVRKEVETLLADTQRDASTLKSRLEALQFDVANTDIKAPSEGVVMGLTVNTVGGVVAAGSPMMEIVPKNEALRIEAQILPHLIDKVKPGLEVDILFSAFNQATTPRIAGKIVQVSADVLIEPKQNTPYFKAMVEVTTQGLLKMKGHDIRAGMPVEVFVRTGERTAMNYFIKPLLDRTNRALTEP
jgi:membrane fusion protein, protease secretion system